MHFVLISLMHKFFIFIRGLIGVITSNCWLVEDDFISPIILFRSPVFHDTFWTDKVSLSFANQSIFYVFNCLHFTSFWWFCDMRPVEDRKILMRDRCIICGDVRSFFLPPSVEPLALSFGIVSLTTVCDFFLLMVFIFYAIWVPFHYLVLVLIFSLYFSLSLGLIFYF